VWAPALVGWVGGDGFRDRNRHMPATGWYPLTPHDRYIPTWRAPDNHLRWLNEHVRDDPRRPRDYRPQGLTVVPEDRFRQPGRVNVPRTPITTVPPVLVRNVTPGAPPAAPERPNWPNRGPVGIARMDGRHVDPGRVRRIETERAGRDAVVSQPRTPGLVPQAVPAQPLPITSPTPHLPPQPLSTVTSPTPHQSPQPLSTVSPTIPQPQAAPPAGVPDNWMREWKERGARREQLEEMRRNRQPVQQPQPQQQPMMAAPAPQPVPQPIQRIERPQPRFERPEPRIERTEARIERPAPPPPPVERPAPPPVQMAPRPAPVAAPAPPTAPAKAEAHRGRVDQRGRDQKER
jgi:hypothetical protein